MRGDARTKDRLGGGRSEPIKRDALSIDSQCRLYILVSERSTIELTGAIDDPALIEAIRRYFNRRPS